jgi:hypothetical protein
MSEWMFNLGDELVERISGISGICVARVEWLDGRRQYVIQPKGHDYEGHPKKGLACEESMIDKVVPRPPQEEKKEEVK